MGRQETVCSNPRGCPQVASLPLGSNAKGQESPPVPSSFPDRLQPSKGNMEFPFNRVSVTTVKLVKKTVWAAEKYTQGRTGNEDA